MKMNKVRQAVLLVCFGFVFLFSGCAQKGATLERIEDKTIDTTHPRAELVLGSKELVKKVIMTNVRVGSIGNFQRAEVGLQNLSKTRFSLEYQINWQDADGFSINSNNAWHRITLGPKQIMNLKSVGKDPNAYKIHVTVRYPDDLFIESHKREQEDK